MRWWKVESNRGSGARTETCEAAAAGTDGRAESQRWRFVRPRGGSPRAGGERLPGSRGPKARGSEADAVRRRCPEQTLTDGGGGSTSREPETGRSRMGTGEGSQRTTNERQKLVRARSCSVIPSDRPAAEPKSTGKPSREEPSISVEPSRRKPGALQRARTAPSGRGELTGRDDRE